MASGVSTGFSPPTFQPFGAYQAQEFEFPTHPEVIEEEERPTEADEAFRTDYIRAYLHYTVPVRVPSAAGTRRKATSRSNINN